MKIEFFFDCSSPWTYLAFENIQPLAAEFDAEIDWRPILVGGIFNAVNPGVEYKKRLATEPPRKMAYFLKDLRDWESASGLKIIFPPPGHLGTPASGKARFLGACRFSRLFWGGTRYFQRGGTQKIERCTGG